MFIVYTSDDEVIVTTKDNDKNTIKEYFDEGGRNIDDYDRDEIKDGAVAISPKMKVKW